MTTFNTYIPFGLLKDKENIRVYNTIHNVFIHMVSLCFKVYVI